jgi:glycosyltransferase involved in cell wall biosynthesis
MESKRMKIAFLSDSIYPYNKGGKETRSYEIATHLAKKGHDIHFYTMKFWKGKDVIKKDGFYLHGICKEYKLYSKNGGRNIKQALAFGFSSFKLLKENFDVLDADHMVYFHLFPAKLTCLIKRKPMFISWHEVWGKDYWEKYMGKKGIIGATIEKISSRLGNKIIAISEETKKNLVEVLKIPKEKVVVVENGINFKKIQKIKPSKEKSDLIFCGRLNEHKNVDVLIKVVAKVKKKNTKIKCIITGDGPERKKLEKLVKELKLEKNIIFKGFIENSKNVLALIKSSKVFVSPSTREGFGISVIEAHACGLPVITTNYKDNAGRHLIKNGINGYTCKLDVKKFIGRINKGLKSYKKMRKGCLKNGERYDWDGMIRKFEGVYGG